MAHIKPFKGIVYNPAVIGELKDVVAPPYDVISKSMQEHYYDSNPYNIIRLILGKETEKDTGTDNKYTRSRRCFDEWLKKHALEQDKKPSIYIYQQTYLHEGKKRTRIGFMANMRIEDPNKSRVLPHEYTLAKPKVDRLNLIKQVKANLSPIFALFYEKNCSVTNLLKNFAKKNIPLISIDFEGVTHRLWRISDNGTIDKIKKVMRDKKVFIADGHHRYEVARAYRNLMRKKKNYNKNVDHVMMYFTNLKEAGNVTILSTHRLLKDIGDVNEAVIRNSLEPYFDISEHAGVDMLLKSLSEDRVRPRFGIYMGHGQYILISLKKKVLVSKIIKSDKSSQWKRLSVTVLHNFIIGNLLSLKDSEDNVKYVREPEDAVQLVDSGEYKIAFFLNPTKAYQVKEVAEKGDMMPQKSTYFYPKLLTGLVVNKF